MALPALMFGQTFAATDLPVIGFLILLEGLLSADNALVLATMVRHLPPDQQRRALLYGLGGAFVFRFFAILLAAQILSLWWLQLVGAAYLLYVAGKHFVGVASPQRAVKAGKGFWATVVAVEVTDIAFAVDSVLAAVAVVRGADKLWVVYTGAILGVILLRFAAGLFVGLLERYPSLDHMAYALVAWVGVKLTFMALHHGVEFVEHDRGAKLGFAIPMLDPRLFWVVMAVIVLFGVVYARRHPKAEGPETTTP